MSPGIQAPVTCAASFLAGRSGAAASPRGDRGTGDLDRDVGGGQKILHSEHRPGTVAIDAKIEVQIVTTTAGVFDANQESVAIPAATFHNAIQFQSVQTGAVRWAPQKPAIGDPDAGGIEVRAEWSARAGEDRTGIAYIVVRKAGDIAPGAEQIGHEAGVIGRNNRDTLLLQETGNGCSAELAMAVARCPEEGNLKRSGKHAIAIPNDEAGRLKSTTGLDGKPIQTGDREREAGWRAFTGDEPIIGDSEHHTIQRVLGADTARETARDANTAGEDLLPTLGEPGTRERGRARGADREHIDHGGNRTIDATQDVV